MAKMKTCKHCGAVIANNAKICPACGGKNSKPIFKRVWFWILVVLVAFFILFGGSASHKLSDEAIEMSEDEFKAACIEVDYKDLLRDPDSYIGQKIVFKGRVNQVIYESETGEAESQYKVATSYDSFLDDYYEDDIVLYFVRGDGSRLLEDDIITVYGEFVGTETYTTVLNAKVTVPAIRGAYIEVQE